ncbi:MAG: chemotaxis protein CheB [Pseudoxanthomonas sp.]
MSASETLTRPRVALLAREGRARDQLSRALKESGAETVLVADPNALDAHTLRASMPQAVLVALEPAVEDSVFRLDEVLHDPALNVIFDDAELALQREGWDAQRWARHLSAKLFGHADVLPPGREADDPQIQPGLPTTPAQLHADVPLASYLSEAQSKGPDLPTDGLGNLSTPALSLADIEPAAPKVFETFAFDVPAPPSADTDSRLQLVDDETPELPAQAFSVEIDSWKSSERPALALVDSFDAPVAHDVAPAPVRNGPPPLPPIAPSQVEVPVAPLPAPRTGGLTLELEALDNAPAGAGAKGAVVILAGIGGPDAVRRVLSGLPSGTPKPVLIQLRLDGGRYDNLVRQIARISEMPVLLADAGQSAAAGHVYVLPDEIDADVTGEGTVRFVQGAGNTGALLSRLPASDSAVLLLSGADVSAVEPALLLGRHGAFVGGQSPQGCYDPAAVRELQSLGGNVATPEDLAAELFGHLYS